MGVARSYKDFNLTGLTPRYEWLLRPQAPTSLVRYRDWLLLTVRSMTKVGNIFSIEQYLFFCFSLKPSFWPHYKLIKVKVCCTLYKWLKFLQSVAKDENCWLQNSHLTGIPQPSSHIFDDLQFLSSSVMVSYMSSTVKQVQNEEDVLFCMAAV